MFQTPKQGDEFCRRGLEQGGNEDVVETETHAVAPQGGTTVLVDLLDVLGNVLAGQNTEIFGETIGDAAPRALQLLGSGKILQGLEQCFDVMGDKAVSPRLDLFLCRRRNQIIDQNEGARCQPIVAGGKRAHRLAEPAQLAVRTERDVAIGRQREPCGARLEFQSKRFLCGSHDGLGVRSFGGLVGGEAESLEFPHGMSFDRYLAALVHACFQHRVLSQSLHQDRGPAVHKTLCQALVQRIRQAVFYSTRALSPMGSIPQPAGAMRDISPCPDLRDPLGQCVDFAVGPVGPRHLFGHVVLVDMAAANEVEIECGHDFGMLCGRDLAVVRQGAGFPKPFDA